MSNPYSASLDASRSYLRDGRPADAERIARELVEAAPQSVAGWELLGDIELMRNDAAAAANRYATALGLEPDLVPVGIKLAVALARQGRHPEAEVRLRSVIQVAPDHAPAHLNLGVLVGEQGRRDEAEACFRRAVELDPGYAEAHFNLGNALLFGSRRHEAIASFRRALDLRPDHAESLVGLCDALMDAKRSAEAVVLLQQAIRLRHPDDDTRLRNMLATALGSLGRFAEAEACLEHVLRNDPKNAAALVNLGNVFKEQGRTEEALGYYDLAIRQEPKSYTARWNRSLALLQAGQYERGFAEYESRWERPNMPSRAFPAPRWEGQPLNGRSVLLWPEQGLGDTIHFARYARLVKEAGGHVVFQCQSPLASVMAKCDGIDQLVVEGQPLPPYDFQIPLLSLPRFFNTAPATVAAPVPYIHPEPDRAKAWEAKLDEMVAPGDLRVGIAWQGNPHHSWDQFRSCPLIRYEPLTWVPGVQLISLQRGPGTEQIAAFQQLTGGRLCVPTNGLQTTPEDLADSVAIMKHLDLVITVDTATAHLAGALGVRTWILLADVCDWRWMRGRADSPWYPSARLFRQTRLKEWGGVMDEVARHLTRLANVNGKRRTESP